MLSASTKPSGVHLDRIVGDVAPTLILGEALLQPRLGLVGRQQVAHPLRAGLLGVVVVHGLRTGVRSPRSTARSAVRTVWSNTTTLAAPVSRLISASTSA